MRAPKAPGGSRRPAGKGAGGGGRKSGRPDPRTRGGTVPRPRPRPGRGGERRRAPDGHRGGGPRPRREARRARAGPRARAGQGRGERRVGEARRRRGRAPGGRPRLPHARRGAGPHDHPSLGITLVGQGPRPQLPCPTHTSLQVHGPWNSKRTPVAETGPGAPVLTGHPVSSNLRVHRSSLDAELRAETRSRLPLLRFVGVFLFLRVTNHRRGCHTLPQPNQLEVPENVEMRTY